MRNHEISHDRDINWEKLAVAKIGGAQKRTDKNAIRLGWGFYCDFFFLKKKAKWIR